MALENRLVITNLQGVQRMSVSFTEAEGQPMMLATNNSYELERSPPHAALPR
jgi:hypothetical protein